VFAFAKRKVFSDLGRGMLDNAWQGYNCSLFAYGQTGSGKSYSVMGSDNNRGKFCTSSFVTFVEFFFHQL